MYGQPIEPGGSLAICWDSFLFFLRKTYKSRVRRKINTKTKLAPISLSLSDLALVLLCNKVMNMVAYKFLVFFSHIEMDGEVRFFI